ncbi:MAG TPA: CpaF family protein, partial [Burkholderiaceae bacterium]|nr:CpaF family protein [Burkholderiaceae bacterium]
LCEEVLNEAVGLGPLEPLLADPHINEIMVNRHDEIFVEQEGQLKRHPSVFSSEQAVLSVIERIVSPLGRRIDESSPMVDARLPDGSRVNAVIPPIALRGASVTIRKFPDKRPSMADLLRGGALNEAMAQFLKACVIDRKNIVISGGTGSGKTTLLNILSNFIPNGERVVTIEDAAELKLHHEHLVTLEARPANLEGRGQIAIRDLVRNALRMRPDRIVIGECRGSEAFDMLAAMNTGHEGSLTTLHANSPRDALARLETMILMAGMDLPLAAIREHIASSINLIIQQVRTRTGQRLIKSLVEVTGMESGRIQTQDLFLYQEGPPPVFTSSGLMPEFINKGSNTALSRLSHSLFSEQSAQPSAQLQRSPSENTITF